MLTCSHITQEKCVERVPKEMFRKKQSMEELNLFVEGNGNRRKGGKDQESFKTFCDECDACGKSWMCLECGRILCGRNDLSHAMDHFEQTDHSVVIDCITFELYCYQCDDEVSLDFEPSLFRVLESLRLLFDREEVMEGGNGTLPSSVSELTKTFASVVKVAPPPPTQPPSNNKNASKKKRGKKGKVSPMFDPPFQGNVINCTPSGTVGPSAPPVPVESPFKPRGIRNIGNTCFMNAALQALASIDAFKEYLMSLPPLSEYLEDEKEEKNGNCYLTDEYRKFLIALSARNFRDPTAPHDFREAFISACPRFRGFRQHDSHEFLRYFLDQLNIEMKKCRHLPEMPEDVTPVGRFFEGILQSRVICKTCDNASNKNDEIMDLSLDIPRNNRRVRLQDCLDLFFEREVLEKGEKPTCSKCKTKQTSSKQMFIKKLPEVLCLHIKRFRDCGGKMDTLIEYPMTGLSVDEFLTEDSDEPPCVYDLQSIIVHIGYGCGSGHYISYGKRAGGVWWQFDDAICKQVDAATVSKQRAYILLYTKTSRKP